jgi:hypothetical protein
MKYIRQLKEKYCDNSICKPSTPIQPGMLHHRSGDDEERIDKTWYRSVIGSLLYIATSTRADICFAVLLLSRRMEDLCRRHGAALRRLLDYVVYMAETNMRFPFSKKETIDLKCWVNADLRGPQLNNVSVNEMVDGRSQTGILVAVNNMAVVFKSKPQPKTAKSSTHSELIASCEGVSEMGIICELVHAMVQEKRIAGKKLLIDNENALRSISTGFTRQATRHVKLDLKSSREIMNEAGINMMFVGTKENLADGLTKSISEPTMVEHMQKVNLCFPEGMQENGGSCKLLTSEQNDNRVESKPQIEYNEEKEATPRLQYSLPLTTMPQNKYCKEIIVANEKNKDNRGNK